MSRKLLVSLLLLLLFGAACNGDPSAGSGQATPTPALIIPPTGTAVPPASDTPLPTLTEVFNTMTATATTTPTATPTSTPTATATPTGTVLPASNNAGAASDPAGDLAATLLPELLPSVIPEIPEIPVIPGGK